MSGQRTDQTHADPGAELLSELESRMVALESRSNDLAARVESAVQLGESIRTDINKLVASLDPILSEAKSGGAAVDGFARELIGHLVTIIRKVVPHEMAAVDQAVSDATARKPSEAPA